MGPASDYDRALYLSLPVWYNPCYVVAVLSGAGGAAACSRGRERRYRSRWVALVTVIVMFGWIFLATDMIAHKGVATAVTFPIVVALIAAFQLWLSRLAAARGWIG